MSAGRASQLEEESRNIVPGLFQALVSYDRPVLLEVCCDSDSFLSAAVQEHTGWAGAAQRLSLWNGADLSTSAGVRNVLERIASNNPGTVWISPPCGPFSPLQHTNSRTPEQSEELKRKREYARRIYAGAAIIFRFCMQRGVHCVWEMSERSDAWRLPVLQELVRRYDPHVCVTHGCRVGLRDKDGSRLVRKGWKLITTHGRLAQEMHLECCCAKNYQHGKCEGETATRSARYTKSFASPVAKALALELTSYLVQQECQGSSSLPEVFGEGMMCQCRELPRETPGKCGACLLGELVVQGSQASGTSGHPSPQASQELVTQDFEPEPQVDEAYSAVEVQQAEARAQQLLQTKDWSTKACEGLIRSLPLKPQAARPGQLGSDKVKYFVFGAYAHGAQYGITNRTSQFPKCVQYLNMYMKQKTNNSRKWTSLVVNVNNSMPLHRDVNNQEQQPNLVIGVSSYSGGGLWVQETTQGIRLNQGMEKQTTLTSRCTPHGETVWGRVFETKDKVVEFPPKAWHETEEWSGERVIISAYSSRAQGHLSPENLQQLRITGFPLPPQPNRTAVGVYVVGSSERDRKQEIERLKKQLYLLHAATGHCSTKYLVDALKRRNAKPEVLKLAAEFRCSICEERKKVTPRNLASLEPLPPKFHTVAADIGHWRHPKSGEHHQFMTLIDEGSRFRIAKILSVGAKQQPSGATCIAYLREGWAQIFGNPRTLRLDPAGNFRSEAVSDYCHRHGIFLDLVPGEAHWRIGVCEQAVQGLKMVMDKLAAAEDSISAEEALATAVRIFNQRDLIRGFSPAQHVLGQVPDETGRIDVVTPALPPELLIENPTTEFQQAVQRRVEAEKAHSEWNARQRLNRAQNSRSRPVMDYHPGELVFYWRQQDSSKKQAGTGIQEGVLSGTCKDSCHRGSKEPRWNVSPWFHCVVRSRPTAGEVLC